MIRTRIAFDFDYLRTVTGAPQSVVAIRPQRFIPPFKTFQGSKPFIGWLPFLVSVVFGDPLRQS